MDIRPFRGYRPRADLASRIPSVPYDVVDDAEARALVADEPLSFLRVVRPEVDFDPPIPPYDDRVYARGRDNLAGLIDRGELVRDTRPAYYVYRLTMGEHVQTGVLGAAAIADYLDGKIKRHEHTRPEKEEDRVRLNLALEACPGPVFLAYRPLPELNATVNGVTAGQAEACFTTAAGVEHALWVVRDEAVCRRIADLFRKVRATYVADGHHRAAAAAKVGARLIDQREEAGPDAPPRFFLAAHFPADQLTVLDYNRVVRDLNGLDVPTLLERIEAAGFSIKENPPGRRPPHRRTFGMYVEGSWRRLTARAEVLSGDDPVRGLDVAILTQRILQPVLGIGDPRTDRRLDFVGGIRGMGELERRVDGGEFAVAFALFPTSLDDVMAVADAGEVMPPKSTWFEPKLLSGLVVQSLAGEAL